MRVALVTHNARFGDAIGNLVAEKLALFLERGADARVLLESTAGLHPRVGPHAQVMRAEPAGTGWDFLADADLACVEFGQWYGLLGLLPLLSPGKPRILLDYHSISPPEFAEKNQHEALVRGRQHRGLAWAADLTLVHSRFTYRELVKATGIPQERLCRLGFPIAKRLHPETDPKVWKRSLGPANSRILLFVGRLAPNKRVPVLVEALSRLRDLDPPVHAVIIGDTGDIYQKEAERCRQLARNLGVGERLHFLGHVSEEILAAAYRGADAFVMPSLWEGFCIPVLEAMASGVPILAARAGALPETVAGAGVTFRPDDPDDLARQIRRILVSGGVVSGRVVGSHSPLITHHSPLITHHSLKRVAIVSTRYGNDFAGGAEWSLRRIATALFLAGHPVEVFATCTRSESNWSNELAVGTSRDGEIPVHRFRLGSHDRRRHLETVRAINESEGKVAAEIEQAYLDHSLHSPDLIEKLRQREDDFDAIIVGPYLFGLTWDVACTFEDKTLLLPCFHDEPMARLAVWPETYERVAGILYHSVEEQDLAQSEFGLNHPNAQVIGTWMEERGSARALERGSADSALALLRSALCAPRFLVYCGRYSRQKELPTLLEYARRYHAQSPGRFTFVFMGQGEVVIPRDDWARDLGFVSDQEKYRVLAEADALVQLSHFESLSLAALEAWSLGTPVIASQACPVLAGHIDRCGGGRNVTDYGSFAATLDELWEQPSAWQLRGRQGQEYVRDNYGSLVGFQRRLDDALAGMDLPLPEQMRLQGLKRAALFSLSAWREQFSNLVEKVLHAPALPHHEQVEISLYNAEIKAAPVADVLIGVRLTNRGTHPLLAEGPGGTSLFCQVQDAHTQEPISSVLETALPTMLLPEQSAPAAILLRVPENPGRYRLVLWAQKASRACKPPVGTPPMQRGLTPPARQSALLLVEESSKMNNGFCAPLLESVQSILAQAHRRQRLPDDYIDVSEGFLARCKRWLKQKLLNNFKRAYVDVLSRQQSGVNQQLVNAVQELAECCATLDHAVRVLQERLARVESGVRSQESGATSQESGVSSTQSGCGDRESRVTDLIQ